MKLNLIALSAAAGVLAATGAQAADLPVAPAPEPIDYVRICDAYGTGYFFIPGTETCMKIDGFVRVNVSGTFTNEKGGNNTQWGAQQTTPLDMYARGRVNFDVRENTAWGTLRGYIRLEVEKDLDSDSDGLNEGEADDTAAGPIFIQVGDGFLAGYAGSNFNFWTGYVAGSTAVASDETILQVAYTAEFGNGIFATLALEDSQDHGNAILSSATLAGVTVADGQRYPDIVGNIAYEQGIVSAQVMAALHWVGATNSLGTLAGVGNISDKVGFAVAGGVTVDLPFMAGVSMALQGGYAHGAPQYICALCAGGQFADAVVNATTGALTLTNSYSVAGGINASVTDTISVQAQGGYARITGGGLRSGVITAGVGAAWSPLDNLTLSTGLDFTHATSNTRTGEVWDTSYTVRLQRNF